MSRVNRIVLCSLLTASLLALQTPVSAAESIPKTKQIQYQLEGMTQTKTGNLFLSNQGYYMYTVPLFKASAEEPGRDIVFATSDDRFFLRIERLPKDADIAKLRANAETELKEIASVTEVKGDDALGDLRQAKFFLHTASEKLTKDIIVTEFGGALFRLTVHIPSTEAAEGFGPAMYAMIKTITPLPNNGTQLK